MRVLHIITTLSSGGAEKMLVDIVGEMEEQGVDCEVLVLIDEENLFGERLSELNIPIYYGKAKKIFSLRHIFFIQKIIRKNQYDCIHTHLTHPQIYTLLAMKLLRKKTPLITTEHSTFNRRRKQKWFYRLDRWLYRQYDKIIAISKGTKKNLSTYLPETEHKTVIIENGINLEQYKSAKSLKKELIDKTIRPEDKLVLMVARMDNQKDHETLIRASKHLPTHYRVMFVGNGPRFHTIQNYAFENGRKDIIFLGERSDVPSLMATSNLFVLCSKWEGFGLVVIEAAASGLPIVASNVDGLKEVVQDIGGTLFKSGDEYDLAVKIVESMQEGKQISLKNIEKYSIVNTVSKYIECYKDAILNARLTLSKRKKRKFI